jgi:hypothetical protein
MGKYKSRATRLAIATETISNFADSIGGVTIKDFENSISEIQLLLDEICSWRDNIEGTALENTQKYSDLQECVEILESLDLDIAERDKDTLQDLVAQLMEIEFPVR